MRPANDNRWKPRNFDAVADAAIERAIEDSVRLLVSHGATDEEIEAHVASERQRYAACKADILEQWRRLATLPIDELRVAPSGGLQ